MRNAWFMAAPSVNKFPLRFSVSQNHAVTCLLLVAFARSRPVPCQRTRPAVSFLSLVLGGYLRPTSQPLTLKAGIHGEFATSGHLCMGISTSSARILSILRPPTRWGELVRHRFLTCRPPQAFIKMVAASCTHSQIISLWFHRTFCKQEMFSQEIESVSGPF